MSVSGPKILVLFWGKKGGLSCPLYEQNPPQIVFETFPQNTFNNSKRKRDNIQHSTQKMTFFAVPMVIQVTTATIHSKEIKGNWLSICKSTQCFFAHLSLDPLAEGRFPQKNLLFFWSLSK